MNLIFVSFLFLLLSACSGESNHNSRSYVISQSPSPTELQDPAEQEKAP